jgi:zinc D-Ala-D-Ala dipeptidase
MNFFKCNGTIFLLTLSQINFAFCIASKSELVEVQKVNPKIVIDLVYATDKNFTGKVIYPKAKCLLREEVAEALNKVQLELEKNGFGLKVWDAYRPISAQQKLWDMIAEKYPKEEEREKYVCNPKKGGRHTRGTAVDCTLVNLKDNKEVEKPTEFDHFGKEAWCSYNGPALTAKAKEHREILENAMKKYGFQGLSSEWWHFDFKGWQQCEPLQEEF